MNLRNFFQEHYRVLNHFDRPFYLTAEEFYKRIISDAEQSDYNWLSPAREIVRVCNLPGFPMKYSIPMKVAVLDCFANIEHRANLGLGRNANHPDDTAAVHECYNSLFYVSDSGAPEARRRYLDEMINRAIYMSPFDPLYHPGPTFDGILKEWHQRHFDTYFPHVKVNFYEMQEVVKDDFVKIIKDAEAKGLFKEDDERAAKEREAIIDKIIAPIIDEADNVDCML